jgi:predicted  nucleic acid-binding Zn-ribbon protein
MNNFSTLFNSQHVKHEPEIWFERFVVYRDINDTPIQSINFCKGLNIIRAGDDSIQDEITGHGTGKTTLCRFLRYLLGEPTFSNNHDRKLISKIFDKGCVAAELYVRGEKKTVRRPFDESVSYIIDGGTIEEIISSPPKGVSKNQYIERLSLNTFCEHLNFRNNKPVQWGHLLAWLTRDQETRLTSVHQWRDSESESGAPSFSNPKTDPLFLMRGILDLLSPDEIINEKALSKIEQEIKQQTDKIEKLRTTPSIMIQKSEEELRTVLKNDLSILDGIDELAWECEQSLLDDSLSKISLQQQRLLNNKIQTTLFQKETINKKIKELNQRTWAMGVRLGDAEVTLKILEQTKQANEGKITFSLDENLKLLFNKFCEHVKIQLKDCTHFLALIPQPINTSDKSTAQNISNNEQDSRLQDCHTFEQNAARYETQIINQTERVKQLENEIILLQTEIRNEQEKLQQLETNISSWEKHQNEIKSLHEKIVFWRKKFEMNEELNEAENTLIEMQQSRDKLQKTLTALTKKHKQNFDKFTNVFDRMIKSILTNSSYSGEVSLTSDRDLSFDIFYQNVTSKSVAINILKTILVDIACLTYNAISANASFPGLLIHDSPREADLQIVHYNRIFELILAIQNEFEKIGSCPFQYIITTTTKPPTSINDKSYPTEPLDARVTEKMFLKCRIEQEYAKIIQTDPLIEKSEQNFQSVELL